MTRPSPPNASATIGVANTGLGTILVDSNGRTLYLFKKDEGTTSVCNGTCASEWPPVRANGKPTVGAGRAPRWSPPPSGPTKRHRSPTTATRVYRYYGDENPGDTNGQGLNTFGGRWYALSPAGDEVSGTGSGGGYGY